MANWPLRMAGVVEEEAVTITSAVCAPVNNNSSAHTVFSCVVAHDEVQREALECKISLAPNLEEGVIQGCAQAMELLRLTRDLGQTVSGMHCSHCPSPRNPVCGKLARLPRYLGN